MDCEVMTKRIGTGVFAALALWAASAPAQAQTPDVIVYDIGVDGGNSNDIRYWGQVGGIAAYNIATQSCNSGDAVLNWFDSGGDTRHPVISQNMFRYADGRFEQLGYSWLKHGFCAVNEFETLCGPCNSTNCDTLGVGCADTYWASLNDGRGGRSKRFVSPTLGSHVESGITPTGNNTIRGRLQVAVADIDPALNPDAEYFIEGHYVTLDDHAAGNARNNATWRRVNVVAVNNVDGGGPSQREEPAIYAWQDQDPGVVINVIAHTENDGTSWLYLGHRVTQINATTWRYEYAIQNLNSDQSVSSFTVPVQDASTFIGNVGFHDVDAHSGDPWSTVDWVGTRGPVDLSWATEDFGTNPDANAIRWATLYNFGFDANAPPVSGTVSMGFFKAGPVMSEDIPGVLVPGDAGQGCTVNGSVASRNAGSNLNTYTATAPTFGGTVNIVVTGSYQFGAVFAYNTPASIPLGNGQVVLTDLTSNFMFSSFLTGLPFGTGSVNVPNDLNLCDRTAYTQAILTNPTAGGPPFQLTNAQDLTVGN